jgi:flagellar protein FlaJ
MEVRKAYTSYGTPLGQYLIKFVLPTVALVILATVMVIAFLPWLSLILLVLIAGMMTISVVFVGLYPLILWQKRGREIDEEMHLFITRMGVITSQDIPRGTFVELLQGMEEYKVMGGEIVKIFKLVRTWRMTLAEASRQVSEQTPSKLLSDFLERFAFSIEGGESESEFFAHEQDVVLDQYAIRYEGVLKDMELMKEVFVAMIIASMFVISIVAFLPILTGQSVTSLMVLAIFLFTIIEVGFLYVISSSIPMERTWHRTGIKNDAERRIERSMAMAITAAVILSTALVILGSSEYGGQLGMWSYRSWPWIAAIGIMPLSYPGYIALVEEEKIRRRDENFPAFIRTLGSTAEAKSIAAVTALRKLARHDFGPLTENIRSLSKRLATGIDAKTSWRHFGSETGSDLISKFSDMYVEGVRTGGRSRNMTNLISRNFVRILGLRKKRYQSASDLTGMLYGLMIAVAFAMYITIEILWRVQEMWRGLSTPVGFESVTVLDYSFFNVQIMAAIILILVVSHAFVSSVLLRILGGGHKAGSLIHFVVLVWIAAFVSLIVFLMMDTVMPGT